MFKPLTRVLVLAGVVTLTNAAGSVEGTSGELLAAEEGSAPVKQVAEAGNDFAFGLYQQLARENAGENLFFSPYSVSIALTMTAEGARGRTAEEMGQVLRWPRAMRRLGGDAQRIPWETAKLHSGLASLSRMLSQQQDTPEKQGIRRQIAALEQELKTQKERNVQLRKKDFRAYRAGVEKENQLASRLNKLYGQVDQYELRIANALWGEKTYAFHPDFVKTVSGAYDTGALRMVDFKRDFARQRLLINQWVEDQTKERIKDLLPEGSLDALTRMVLANAIYFKGDWKTPFDEARTREEDFTLADGGTAKVPLMGKDSMPSVRYGAFTAEGALFDTPKMTDRQTPETALYPGENGFAVVELPYRGGDLAMVVIAPNRADGLDALERRLDGEKLNRWVGQLHQRKVNVFLPKFKAETSYDLVGTLTAMGMGSAFGAQADFSGMTASGSRELYISGVFHKAFVDVNEEGTEAAAATAVVMRLRGLPTTRPFIPTFRADQPFVYLIRDCRSGSILFLGRTMQP